MSAGVSTAQIVLHAALLQIGPVANPDRRTDQAFPSARSNCRNVCTP